MISSYMKFELKRSFKDAHYKKKKKNVNNCK